VDTRCWTRSAGGPRAYLLVSLPDNVTADDWELVHGKPGQVIMLHTPKASVDLPRPHAETAHSIHA
jgi:hypothetical protein